MTPQESQAVAQSYRPAVRGWVTECVSARDVDDVVQTVFEAFARDAHKIESRAAAAWLRAVTRTKVVDHARRRREELSDPPEPTSEAPSPEDTLRSSELGAAVRRAMEEVVVSRRRILAAVALEGRPLADVAREEGIPESTAQSRYEQGGRDLRAVMERERAKEKTRSGGFSSWSWTAALVDWTRRAWRSRWARWGLAVTGTAGIVGAIAGWSSAPPPLPARVVAPIAAVTLVEDAPPEDLRTWAPPVETARPVVAAPAPRTHHDLHRHFEQEAFGTR